MKAKLSYKSKRNIVISAIIVVLIALIGTGTYFFTKSNSDQAEAFSDNGMQVGETQGNEGQQGTANNEGNQGEVVEPNLNQNQDGNAEGNNNQTVENGDNNTSSNTNSTTGNNSATTNNGNTSNNGTTGSTTGNVPNEDYVTERVETEDVLVREDYEVAWSPLTIRANTTTEELEIVRPIISAEKFTNKSTVVPGDEIEYTIVVKNSGKISGKTIVKDSAPTDDIETEIQESVNTTFKEGSIKINGEPATKLLEVTSTELEQKVPLTEQDLIDGIEIEVPACTEVETENGTEIVPGETVVSFIVTIDMPEENEEETPNEIKVEGTVKNVAVVNDEDTNPVYNPIITYRKVVDKEVVKYNEQLKYTIIVTNTGDVDGTAIVSDEAPAETVFVEGSLEIDGKPATKLVEATETEQEQEAPLTEQDLKDGIEIEVPANGEVEVSFIATAKDLEDGYIIKNEAKVNNKPTNETETVYQEPIIDAVKATNKSTVTPGDEIEYTITVSNTGSASGKTTVKDSAPTEPVKTTFKAGSIKINGKAETSLTEQDLKDGIEVEVPARTENGAGETTVSFIVKVDEPENGETVEGTVENIAVVNDEETNPVYNPIITYRKIVDKEVVQYNEQLKYTIIVTNTGKVNGTAILSDEAPRETVFVENSIEIDGKPATKIIEETETEPEQEVPLTEQDLKDGIEIEVPANGKVEVSFIATAKDLEDGYIIKNEAKVNNKPTNETETVYQEPIIDAVKATNKETVVPGDEIEYTITVSNTGSASGKTTVKDSAPTEPVKTTFKAGSIKINGKAETSLTEQDLKDGIEVEVPARTENGAGEATVSFIVKVDEPEKGETVEGTVENIAVVNDEKTNPVYNPIIKYWKEVDKAEAKINDTLTYTKVIQNTGSVDGKAIVSDEAPSGTTFKAGSIKINGKATKYTAENLKNGIEVEVPAKGKVKVSFEATVNSNITISPVKNTAKVNGNNTNEVTTKIYTDYRVEYYYGGNTTSDRYDPHTVVVENFEVGKTVGEYEQKPNITKQDGTVDKYKFLEDNLGNNPLVLVGNPKENVIKVYYVKPVLEVTKTDNKNKVTYNNTITYTITVKNLSDVDTKINLSDTLPSYVDYVSDSITITNNEGKDPKATYGYKNGKITYSGTLKANKTLTLKFKAKVNETAQAVIKQGIENIVTVTEECGGSYSDSEVTPVYKEAKVDVAKTLDLILVLDCSNSMEERNSSGEITGRIMPSLKTAATDVIDKLFATNKPTDSTISLITYGNTATTHGTFKYDEKSKLLSKLESAIVLSGNTHIQDALKHTNDLLDDMSANRRKVVLFMSDGAPTFWSSDATSPEVELIQGSGNNNWPKHSWVKDTFTDNTRQKIVSEISDLHKHKKTTVYSVGFNTANLNTTYKQYVEEKGAYKNQTGANDIFWQKKTVKYEGKTYYWISEKDYATYVLNNIATGENYISTSNLITTFNNIVDGLIEPEETYETEVGTNVIKMPEKRAITGKVSVTVGSTTTEYTLAELKSGKQGLKYTEGVGFEWTINQERFTKTLKIKYQVNAE